MPRSTPIKPKGRGPRRPEATAGGSPGLVLIYIIVALVIFGLLAAALVSLSGSSFLSTAQRNNAKRALYAAESGVRHAIGQLKAAGFSQAAMNALNQTPQFSYTDGAAYAVSVYEAAFQSLADQDVAAGGQVTLSIPKGSLPAGFGLPASGVFLLRGFPVDSYETVFMAGHGYEDMDVAAVTGCTLVNSTTVNLTLADHFVIQDGDDTDGTKNDLNDGGYAFLAVRPFADQSVAEGGSLSLPWAARSVFPPVSGVVRVKDQDYSYEEREDDQAGGKVRLLGLRQVQNKAGAFPVSVSAADDFVVLSTPNYSNMVVSSNGQAGQGGTQVTRTLASNTYGTSTAWEHKADISFEADMEDFTDPIASNPNAIYVDEGLKLIGMGGSVYYAFGALWYTGDKYSGRSGYSCTGGECAFIKGYRASYTFEFLSADADGYVFTTMNAALNDTTSVGGDSSLGECVGYSGDSRVYDTNNGSFGDGDIKAFLDGKGLGLQPPKMGIDFDTYYNANGKPMCPGSSKSCSGDRANTREEPGNYNGDGSSKGRDHVSLMFWGSETTAECLRDCKKKNAGVQGNINSTGLKSFDDNRHGAGLNSDADADHAVFPRPGYVSTDLAAHGFSTSNKDWFTEAATPFAVRTQVDRESTDANGDGAHTYRVRVWLKACATADCSDLLDNAAVNFTRTRVEYQPPSQPDLIIDRTVTLTPAQHANFDQFLFGWTEATGAKTQFAEIKNFELSFIRPSDPIVTH